MPSLHLRPVTSEQPVAGLIARGGAQVQALSSKLQGRRDLMLVTGDDWAAAFSFQAPVSLPWMPDKPVYLYALAPGVLCQSGVAPEVPAPLLPSLVERLAAKGAVALTDGPMLWDFSAAIPVERCNVRAFA